MLRSPMLILRVIQLILPRRAQVGVTKAASAYVRIHPQCTVRPNPNGGSFLCIPDLLL